MGKRGASSGHRASLYPILITLHQTGSAKGKMELVSTVCVLEPSQGRALGLSPQQGFGNEEWMLKRRTNALGASVRRERRSFKTRSQQKRRFSKGDLSVPTHTH